MTQKINNVNSTKEILIDKTIEKVKKYSNKNIESLEEAIDVIECLTPKKKEKGYDLSKMDEAEIIDLANDMLLATKMSIRKRILVDFNA